MPYPEEIITTFDLKGVWKAMEECLKIGLTKSIGVSNFTRKKLDDLLSFAIIPPSVNQVRQYNLLDYFLFFPIHRFCFEIYFIFYFEVEF
jgi:diketogulonate reductase-like aldo/keto reductase